MKKLVIMLAALALVAAGLFTTAPPVSASTPDTTTAAASEVQARGLTRCVRGSGPGSGRCFTFLRSRKVVKAVEGIPLENRSSRPATMHCSFSRTITKSVTAGVKVSASVKGTIFGVVEASVSTEVSMSVTQTASQASTAGGSVRLQPGQSVTCLRTYGHVVARVKDYRW